uniref:Uncharacterized protein n=1 Tax=Moniliophthora roreri TaxID=221103 RepID=A0A0W0G6Q1_MONRR
MLVPPGGSSLPSPPPTPSPRLAPLPPRIRCPVCLEHGTPKDFGRCIGAPGSSVHAHHPKEDRGGVSKSLKRKRSPPRLQTGRKAHPPRTAPCHTCLDDIGEEEGLVWGRCDNRECWSRKGEVKGGSVGLACPSCSPEGGLGCAHKWICDLCAFFSTSKRPLVWECRGCQNPFCDECPEVHADDEEDEDKCIDCGKGDFLCQDCRHQIFNSSPRSVDFEFEQVRIQPSTIAPTAYPHCVEAVEVF